MSKIIGTDKELGKTVLGLGSPPMWHGENCDALLDGAFEAGIRTFDTARGYGKSENVLGEWLKKSGKADECFIISKGALTGKLNVNRVNEKCIRADLDKSLDALGVSIDLYLLHRDNKKRPVGEIVELMNELVKSGKIKSYGVSNWSAERIREANDYADKRGLMKIAASEVQYSLCAPHRWVWWGCLSVSGKDKKNEREFYKETGLPLLAYSPLGAGLFTGKLKSDDVKNTKKYLSSICRIMYLCKANVELLKRVETLALKLNKSVAQIALAYLHKSELDVSVICGNTSVNNLLNNAEAENIELDKDDLLFLDGTDTI